MEPEGTLAIGEVADQSGVPASTLRYYEKVGLLEPVERQSGRRRYAPRAVEKLAVINLCKQAGFTLEEIAFLFADSSPQRARSRALARVKLTELQDRIDELTAAHAAIEWGLRCRCPRLDDCTCGIHAPTPEPATPGAVRAQAG